MGDDDFEDFFQAGEDPLQPEAVESHPVKVPPRLGLLSNLTHQQFDVVARSAKLKFYETGTTVFTQGDSADRFYILVDGKASVIRDGEIIGELSDGSFFGESALLVEGNRSATVQTNTPCSMWSVDYTTFNDVVSDQLLENDDVRREVLERIENTPQSSFE